MAQAPGREANSLRLARPVNSWRQMADGVGFEPTRPLRAYGISSAAPSTELGDPSRVHFSQEGSVAKLRRRTPLQAHCYQARGRPCDPFVSPHCANNLDSSPQVGRSNYLLAGGEEGRPMAFGPSGPATITVSVMATNSPCSTTPVTFLSSTPNRSASSIPPSNIKSRMRLPLSVTKGASSPPLTVRLAPSAISRSAEARHRKGSTSTGSTPTPSRLTSFDSSTTTTKRLEAPATSFSLNSAPPRPLIKFSAGSTSSAPSTARSIWPSSSVTIGMPSPAASSAVSRDDGTPRTFIPSATRRPRPSVKNRAVVPLPRPTSIPSWTSSRAFSAAACFRSSVKSFAYGPDAGGDPALVAVDRITGDQYRRPCRHDQRRGPGIDASVDLDLDLRGHRAQTSDLLRAVRDEFLAAESGLHRHHVDQVDVWQDLAQVFDRRRGVDRHACVHAQLLDRLHRSVQRTRSLHLYLDQSCSRLCERLEKQLGSQDHEVGFDGQRCCFAHRLDDKRTEGEVRHEVAVHDIDLDPVSARGLRLLDLFGETTDVSRQD